MSSNDRVTTCVGRCTECVGRCTAPQKQCPTLAGHIACKKLGEGRGRTGNTTRSNMGQKFRRSDETIFSVGRHCVARILARTCRRRAPYIYNYMAEENLSGLSAKELYKLKLKQIKARAG